MLNKPFRMPKKALTSTQMLSAVTKHKPKLYKSRSSLKPLDIDAVEYVKEFQKTVTELNGRGLTLGRLRSESFQIDKILLKDQMIAIGNVMKNKQKHTSKPKPLTHLYIFKIGNDDQHIYKIGCSDNIENRKKEGKTWCSEIQTVATRRIPINKSANWRYYEKKLHMRFSSNKCVNGGNEIFEFSETELETAKKYLKNLRF